jgi:hypothetical protein
MRGAGLHGNDFSLKNKVGLIRQTGEIYFFNNLLVESRGKNGRGVWLFNVAVSRSGFSANILSEAAS